MARRRIRMDKFQGGLWLSGSRDSTPDGFLRRARGISRVPMVSIRSRGSETLLYTLPAHSLYKFSGARYQGSGATLYKNGAALANFANSGRLAFLRMPPTIGITDYLFVTGGGTLQKVKADGSLSNWGIAAPADGMTASLGTQLTKTIDNLDASAGSYTAVNCTLANEGSILQVGSGSLKMTVTAGNTIATATRTGLTLDLTEFATGPTESPDEDYIEAWIRIQGSSSNIDYCAIKFDVDDGTFNTNYYTAKIFPTPEESPQETQGIGIIPSFDSQSSEGGAVGSSDTANQGTTADGVTGSDDSVTANATWTHLRIPKRAFAHDTAGTKDWSTTVAVQLLVKTNGLGGVTVYWDDIILAGGAGMVGKYKYQVTFRNSVTGSRSNPNPTEIELDNVSRQPVSLASIPVSTDPQVNQREIWRTVGNGARFWRAAVINDNTTTTYTDRTADFVGLDSSSGVSVLETEELPLDNDPPAATYNDTYGPWNGRAWWTKDSASGAEGLVYYSPAGRAESVQGFVRVSNTDDPTQKGVIWNGVNYVFTREKVYRIDNTTEPFLSREVFGAPGTIAPYTVAATPFGICYQALDGIRLFDGSFSRLLFPEGILPILQGIASENLGAFSGTVGAYADDEYIISDGSQTLACNLRVGRWRDLGIGCGALYHEMDTDIVTATVFNRVVTLDQIGSLSSGTYFEVQTKAAEFDVIPTVLERVYIDAQTSGNSLTATVDLDEESIELGAIDGPQRMLHRFSVNKLCRLADINLKGTVGSQVEIYAVTFEVREIPLYLISNQQATLRLSTAPAEITGNVVDISQGISYYGIDDAVALMDIIYVPEIRRLYLDVNTHGAEITPRLEFLNGERALPPFVGTERRMTFWDINEPDRLVALHLEGDFRTIQLYQVAIDVQIGEAL